MASSPPGLQVLICDDSPLARKQMARALPPEWPAQVQFAASGREGLEKVRAGGIDALFLDLNMPEMNGYQVLQAIHGEDLPCMTLVVSGDVQPQARRWVLDHGALDFISKPVDREQLRAILLQFGLLRHDTANADQQLISELPAPAFLDVIREVFNVAMGQAGGRLGELLDTFIRLPVPRVHQTIYADLIALLAFQGETRLHAISQGFSARGLSGEAILLMRRDDLAQLRLPYNAAVPHQEEAQTGLEEMVDDRLLSTLLDVSGLLAGSCLRGMSEQFDLSFNHSYPVILGRDQSLRSLIGDESAGQEVLVVEMCYTLEDDIACDLLIAFTEDSIPVLEQRAALLRQDHDPVETGATS